MMIAISLIFTIILLCRYLLLRRDAQHLETQLKKINHHSQTNQLLTNPHHFRELSGLIQQINQEISIKNLAIEELEERERQVKEQFTNISHDLRTPLAAMLGYLTLLEEEEEQSQQDYYRQLIQQKARQLQQLIDTYYDFSRIASFDLPLVMTTVEIHSMLTQLLATYYTQFKEQEIRPTITLADGPWLILADEQALQRVFTNLIQNCLKYGYGEFILSRPNEQQLILQNKLREPSTLNINQVFQRLYTSDGTRNQRSTGLGLTVTKQLLEQMGHSISASLEKDLFTITITWHQT